MKSGSFGIIPLIIAIGFGAVLLSQYMGRGEDASTALDEYERYFPGNPLPAGLSCEMDTSYYGEYHTRCDVDGGAHCGYGQVAANRGIIEQAAFYQCHFPVAYLTAEYGHYRLAQRYRRSLVLRWSSVYAQVSHTGWLYAMQPVVAVIWWRPVQTDATRT